MESEKDVTEAEMRQKSIEAEIEEKLKMLRGLSLNST